uniref:Triacylglycerol lipase n=1 Tax=Solanum tuberosum TaxID=4113 RepID=M1ATX1_SOLTU
MASAQVLKKQEHLQAGKKKGELEAVKMEYANVQLECNAADERAKVLASEVIGLEEKDNVGKLEVDAANCKTIFLSEYVVVSFN